MCPHTVRKSADNSKLQICVDCGVAVSDVETRPCGGCAHFYHVIGGNICRRRLSFVTAGLRVTFYLSEDSCYEERR